MRLLNRTLLSFLIYAVVVLLVVTPLFYWAVNEIITANVDETLLLQKKEIEARIQKYLWRVFSFGKTWMEM